MRGLRPTHLRLETRPTPRHVRHPLRGMRLQTCAGGSGRNVPDVRRRPPSRGPVLREVRVANRIRLSRVRVRPRCRWFVLRQVRRASRL